MFELDEVVGEFLVESHENLDQLDRDLVALEQDPGSRELVASIFRTIHTIKGTCGFLAFHHLEQVTHAGESLLSRIRDGKLALTPERTSVLLQMVDVVRGLLATIEETGGEGDPDHSALIALLEAALEEDFGAAAAVAPDPVAEPAPAAPEDPALVAAEDVVVAVEAAELVEASYVLDAEPTEPAADPEPVAVEEPELAVTPDTPASSAADAAVAERDREVAMAHDEVSPELPDPQDTAQAEPGPAAPRIGEVLVAHGVVEPVDVARALVHQELSPSDPKLGEVLVQHGAATQEEVDLALLEQEANKPGDGEHRRSIADSTLRVDVDLLDSLMRLVGELVLTRNQFVANSARMDSGMVRATQRLNLIASELQEGVMKTRMQPIDNVWSKLPRVVRDLGVSCGRQVKLVMEGRDTELDKTILEAVKDPLTHLVRNAIDHGIEPPDVRRAKGKPAEGTLALRAFHEGGQVNIEVSDDGAGMDPQALAAKAVEKGIISRDVAARMSDRDLFNLIFAPGFSTAVKVSNVSGRGVGMDVVKTNVENIGGVVDISSELGVGTTVRMKIPLTLAIIPTVTIETGGERFAIPQISLVELVSLKDDDGASRIESISGAPVYRLRGRLLPLVFLNDLLGLYSEATEDSQNIAVLQADGQQFGLVVDQVLNTEEIVVKPLSQQLKRLQMYSGATILGDGRVALILDVLALAQRANVLAMDRAKLSELSDQVDASALDEDTETHLLVRLGTDRRMAIPLSDVTRLEEFPVSAVERAGHREAVQYRNRILPLLRLADVFGATPAYEQPESLQVVVHTAHDHAVGLVVDEILDITSGQMGARDDIAEMGLQGSAVLQERITELLEVAQAIAMADPVLADALAESDLPLGV